MKCFACDTEPSEKTRTCECGGTSASPCSAWVAFLSDGDRAYPVCTAAYEDSARVEGRRIVGEKDAYFISVHSVPNAEVEFQEGSASE